MVAMRFAFLILALCLSVAPMTAKAGDFIPYLDSVPLMDGFTASADNALIFDKPEGRVIEIDLWCEAACPNDAAITHYYADALGMLGWIKADSGEFIKNNERIQIEIFSAEDGVQKIIRFRSNG